MRRKKKKKQRMRKRDKAQKGNFLKTRTTFRCRKRRKVHHEPLPGPRRRAPGLITWGGSTIKSHPLRVGLGIGRRKKKSRPKSREEQTMAEMDRGRRIQKLLNLLGKTAKGLKFRAECAREGLRTGCLGNWESEGPKRSLRSQRGKGIQYIKGDPKRGKNLRLPGERG